MIEAKRTAVLNVYPSRRGGGAQSVFNNTYLYFKEHKEYVSYCGSFDNDSELKLTRSSFGFCNIIKTTKFIRENKVQIFHFHGGITLGVLYPLLFLYIAFNQKLKCIFTAHNYAIVCPSQKRFDYNKNEICDKCSSSFSFFKYFYSNCEKKNIILKLAKWSYKVSLNIGLRGSRVKILTPSEFSANALMRNSTYDVFSVGNPVDFSNVVLEENDLINEAKPSRICFLGRFVKEKGIELLSREIRRNKSYYTNKEIILIGDGPEKSKLKCELTHLNISFKDFGFCGKNEIQGILATCKVIVVPSVWDETFGLVAAEGIFNRCVPVVSNRGALQEIITKAKIGYVFDVEVDDSLHHAIELSINNYKSIDWKGVLNKFSYKLSDYNYFHIIEGVYKRD
ncbi:hypothetical protein CWN88_08500 [Vibrio splendidus]|uniref:glycosyltransferase family 4 protein n=1 Tax=Vibrio splendidus TaxID=29497 RepID=UPI000D38D88F|nr:glycosyltransferase family 4 protein [Vibrio splendidus]PTP03434.1 hypothetical protein CWN88_08500 [Vibrio splendidus]